MPKIFELNDYKFFFFSNEGDPREMCHIHMRKNGALAKFWLEPDIRLADSVGFTAKELKFIEEATQKNEQLIKEA